MKTLSKIILTMLCFQLTFGFQQRAQAQLGSITKVSTRTYDDLSRKTRIERIGKEREIDTAVEAEEYVKSTLEQNKLFTAQCLNDKQEVASDRAFVLADNIPYSDMQIRNCEQEQQKLIHMNELANELIADYQFDNENESCSTCMVPGAPALGSTPGDEGAASCSLQDQKKFAAEPCNFYCHLKPMLRTATLGIGTGLINLFTGGNDGCPKTDNGLLEGATCAKNLAEGLIKGLWQGISSLVTLAYDAVKWVAKKAYSGAKWLLWDSWHKVEDKSSEKLQAASGSDSQEVNEYNKDHRSWFKKKIDFLLDVIKTLTYQNYFAEQSKCMNCQKRGQLMCEIGGRVASDLVGFTFTLGVGAGALKTIAGKLAPKVAGVMEKFALASSKTGSIAGRVSKVVSPVLKPVKWVGGLAVRSTKAIGKAAVQGWNAFRSSSAYKVIMKAKGSRFVGGLKELGSGAANSIPGKIVLAPFRGVKKVFQGLIKLDSKIFAKGTEVGMRAAGASEISIARAYARATRFKDAYMTDKAGNRVFRMTEGATAEELAQLERAGAQVTPSGEGELVVRMKPKNFDAYTKGKFSTPFDARTGLPVSKDGTTVIEVNGKVIEKQIAEITPKEADELRSKGAIFRTKEHPNAMTALDPNNLGSKGIKVGPEGEIVIKPKGGEPRVVDASEMNIQEIRKLQDEGAVITNTLDAEWQRPLDKIGNPEGSAVQHTASSQMHDLRMDGKSELVNQHGLDGVNELHVMKEPGDIGGTASAAQEKIASKRGMNRAQLEGIESSNPISYEVRDVAKNSKSGRPGGKFLSYEHDGVRYEIPVKRDGQYQVEIYQDGNRAIVKDAGTGKHEIFDFTNSRVPKGEANLRIGKSAGSIPKTDAKLVDEAMGITSNGKPINQAAIDEAKTNLELSGEKGYKEVVGPNGEKQLVVETGPGCKPGSVIIGGNKAL